MNETQRQNDSEQTQWMTAALAAERRTNQRRLWIVSAALTGLLLVVVVAALIVGREVIGYTKAMMGEARTLRDQAATRAAESAGDLAAATARTDAVVAELKRLAEAIQRQEAARVRDSEMFKAELSRFSTWIDGENGRVSRAVSAAQTRLEQFERMLGQQDQAMSRMRDDLTNLSAIVTLAATRPVPVAIPPSISPVSSVRPPLSEDQLLDSAGGTSVVTAVLKSATDSRKVEIVILPSGDRYEGSLRDGLPDGDGTCWYVNGSKYDGQFSRGRKHGRGIFTFSGGDVYSGEYVEDVRQGQGVYTYRDGSRYEGSFNNGTRNGKGRYVFKSGGEYVGEFKDGKKHGIGTHTFADGTHMTGYWQEDRYIGSATPAGK